MGTKSNPSKFDCYAKARYDEPMFVLLARDPSAPNFVRMWADKRASIEGTSEKVMEARKCAADMERWVLIANADVLVKRLGEALKINDIGEVNIVMNDIRAFYKLHYEPVV